MGAKPELRTLDPTDPALRRGRGAEANPSGRFEPFTRMAKDRDWDFGNGWDHRDDEDLPPRLATTVRADNPQTVIARDTSPMFPSTDPSIPIAVASTDASIASPGPPINFLACPLAWISKPN
jgi:hypothetical protein